MGLFEKKIGGRTAVEWFNMGLKAKNPKEKMKCYDKALEIDPKYVGAWNNKGSALYELGRYDEAIKSYDRALEIEPKYVVAWGRKGNALYKLGRYDEAIKSYDRALEIDPKDADAWNNKGNALYNLGRYKEAIECYDKVLEIDPKNAVTWYNKGNALRNLGRYDEAIECYDRALEIDPKVAAVWYNKGFALRNLGKYEEAVECYDRGLEIDPKVAVVWYNKGFALYKLGRYDEAIKCYDRALELDPKFAPAWSNKGDALNNLGRYDEAIECYDRALEIDPKNAVAWNNKGAALYTLGRYDEALKAVDKALVIDPTLENAMPGREKVAESLKQQRTEREKKLGNADDLRAKGRFSEAKEIYSSIGYDDKSKEMEGLDKKLRKAKGYEKALNYEKAAELYEELEMWDDARKCRESLKGQPRNRTVKRNINIPKEDKETDLSGIGDFFSYSIGQKIGKGGFSKVYRIEDEEGSEFAMKIPLDADLKADETLELPEKVLEGFIKEARIWNTLTERKIPGIVELYGFGIRPFPWFVMDLCDESLAQRMKGMDFRDKVDVLTKILNTLNEIHYLGIVHRDIKPQNILFRDNEPLLTDFGLGKALNKASRSSQGYSGTLEYSSPEQFNKRLGGSDRRTDIWQVGVLAYEMFTGRPPFEGDEITEIMFAVLNETPQYPSEINAEIPSNLEDAIMKALEKKKEDRWQSASEFKNALEVMK